MKAAASAKVASGSIHLVGVLFSLIAEKLPKDKPNTTLI